MEILNYDFIQRALLASFLIGIVTSIIGTYVVLRGLAFIGASIAHASFGGVALGLLLGLNPLGTAAVFCLGTGVGIALVSQNKKIREDTAIGIFFAATMAFGIFILGFLDNYATDVFGYLFGDVLAVTPMDLKITVGLTIVILGAVFFLYKEFLFISFDPEAAQAQGFPVKGLNILLIVLIALTVVVSIKVAGIILVSALLIIPAATAYQLARTFRQMQVLALLFSLLANLGGLTLSYFWDTPSGATIVLLATAIFFLVWLLRLKSYGFQNKSN